MIPGVPSEAVLRALLEALESAGLGCTIVLDRGDRLERVFANETLAKIHGIERAVLEKSAPMDRVPPDERERMSNLRPPLDVQGPFAKVETLIVRPDGSSVPIEVSMGTALLDGARATFAFVRDVSAREQMAAALRTSEERFRRVFEASRDSITVFSKGRYVYANPVALELLGLRSADDLAAIDPEKLLSPERMKVVAEHLAQLQRGERPAPLTHLVTVPGGNRIAIEATISLTSMDGEPALISVGRDVTERQRLQAELMKKDRLAAVGVMVAGVAHELNNPLTSLSMQIHRLREDADELAFSADVKAALEHVDESAHRMQAIIKDLLFLARPVEQPQSHVDVVQIVRSTIALLRAGTPACPPVELDVLSLPPIQGYSSKLGQVFFNVLRNAIQAVEGRGSDALVRVVGRCDDDVVEIAIEDNGAGIAADAMAHLTQPLFTTKPDGTGLGLWISEALIQQHGGKMRFTSGDRPGTIVTITLPRVLGTA